MSLIQQSNQWGDFKGQAEQSPSSGKCIRKNAAA